jgi:hypothetical protein
MKHPWPISPEVFPLGGGAARGTPLLHSALSGELTVPATGAEYALIPRFPVTVWLQ